MTEAIASDELDYSPDGGAHTRDSRGSRIPIIAAVVIAVIVLALGVFNGANAILRNADRSSATNQIVPVTAGQPLSGKVSVWVKPGTDIAQLRAGDGLLGEAVDMGNGRYIIEVQTGSEVEAIRRLRETRNVYDAGRVYAVSPK